MISSRERLPYSKKGDVRTVTKFAYLPQKYVDDGHTVTVWLREYVAKQVFVFPDIFDDGWHTMMINGHPTEFKHYMNAHGHSVIGD